MNLHAEIIEQMINEFGEHLADLPRQTHDAVLLQFDTGLSVQIRYADLHAYSLRWTYQGQSLGIDTAPLHPHLDSFPNHLHAADATLHTDRWTRTGQPPWENLRPLITTLLADPLLRGR